MGEGTLDSQPPCGDAATGDTLPFLDLPLAQAVALYVKSFKILPFPG